MAYIGKSPVIGNFVKLDAITVVNGQAAYTMQNGGSNFTDYESVNQFLVSLNGTIQAPTDSFTVSGSTLTFASNLSTGDVIDFIMVFGNSLSAGTPTDGTVSLAKLSATGTKDATTFLRGDNTFATAGVAGISSSADATAITITSAERVGIGETSPDNTLHVNSTSSTVTKFERDSGSNGSLTIGFPSQRATLSASGDMVLNTNSAEQMRLDTSGTLNLLKTNFNAAASSSNRGLEIRANGSGALTLDLNVTDTGTATIMEFNNGNGNAGTIQTSGSSTAYNTSSDYRLKENVNYDFDATSRLKQLKPARFNFIADADTTVDGFIAHEVSSVVPEAISGEKDAIKIWKEGEELPEGVSVGDNKLDENGNPIMDIQGIDQSKLVPLLVKTIQELEARITELENA